MSASKDATTLAIEAFSMLKASDETMLTDENKMLVVQRAQGMALLSVAEMLMRIEKQLQTTNDHLMSIVSELSTLAEQAVSGG